MWRAPPDYLTLNPGHYTIIVQYKQLLFVRGITVSRAKGPGKDLLSVHFRAPQVSPRESTHIPRTSVSPEVHTPVGHTVSGTSPKASLASGKFPTRQSVSSRCPTGCLLLNTQLGQVSLTIMRPRLHYPDSAKYGG